MRKICSIGIVCLLVIGSLLSVSILISDNASAQSDSWTTNLPMSTARCAFGVGVVNGKIYAIGGYKDAYLNVVEEYDPATNLWTTKTPMPTARSHLGVVVVNDKIYAIGGRIGDPRHAEGWNNTVEVYDPVNDVWTTKTPMPTPGYSFAIGVVNGKIYTIGGWGDFLNPVDKNEMYDPLTDSWTTKAPMPTSRGDLVAGVVNGKIYAIGGGDCGITEEYDPITNTWDLKSPMPTGRGLFGIGVVNGKIYAIGGIAGHWATASDTNVNEEYNPITDSWIVKTPLPTTRRGLATAVVNEKIYAIGGGTGHSSSGFVFDWPTYYYTKNEVYTPQEPLTLPGEPQNLQAIPGDGQIVLDWSAPTSDGGASITNYNIYRGSTSGGQTLLTTIGNTLTYTDNSVTNGQTYYYSVSAVNSVGESTKSNVVSATPTAELTLPSAPRDLLASAGDGQVTLTWNAPSSDGNSAITNYMIYRGTSTGSLTLLATIGNVVTYADTGVTNNQTYYYRVTAVNGVGEGAQSSVVNAIPTAENGGEEGGTPGFGLWTLLIATILAFIVTTFIRRKK